MTKVTRQRLVAPRCLKKHRSKQNKLKQPQTYFRPQDYQIIPSQKQEYPVSCFLGSTFSLSSCYNTYSQGLLISTSHVETGRVRTSDLFIAANASNFCNIGLVGLHLVEKESIGLETSCTTHSKM